MNALGIRQERTDRDDELVAVCFPGMDLPSLWESNWEMVEGPDGRMTPYMANHTRPWIDAQRFEEWRQQRAFVNETVPSDDLGGDLEVELTELEELILAHLVG